MIKEQANQTTPSKQKGFTLIELLVVISIIAVLSAVVISSVQSARSKARDVTRYSELVQLRTAINRYYSENGAYPSTAGGWYGSEPGGAFSNNGGNWIPGLVAKGMIPVLPRDPLGGLNPSCLGGTYRTFLYNSVNGTAFKLLSYCAIEGAYPTATNPFYDPKRSTSAVQVSSDPVTAATF